MNVRNRMAQRGIALHHALRYYNGFVRRIIQHLDIELVLGIIDLADRLHQSVDYELLVVNRELDGDAGKLGKLSKRLRGPVLAVAVVHVNQRIAVHSVRGQNHHHYKIGDEQHQVEGIRRVEAFEGLIQELALQIMDDSPLRVDQEEHHQTGTD